MSTKLFALQKLLGRKRDAVMMLLVFSITLTCALSSVMLSESVYQSSQAKAKQIYGGWQAAILNADQKAVNAVKSLSGVESVGFAYKTIPLDAGNAAYSRWIGGFDEEMLALGQFNVVEGRMPQSEGEIALELTTLSGLGVSYHLDQDIELILPVLWEITENGNVMIEEWEKEPRVYHLVGILDSYSMVWQEGGANPDMIVWSGDSLMKNPCITNLYFTTTHTDTELTELFGEVYREHFVLNERLDSAMKQAGAPARIYTVVLLGMTVLAVFLLSVVQMKQRTRSVTLFRGLGATPKQLLQVTIWEGLLLMGPAILFGSSLGICIGWFGGIFLAENYIPDFIPSIPWISLALCGLLWVLCVWLGMILPLWSANRVPLTGAFRMLPGAQVKSRRVRKLLISAISMVLGVTAVYCTSSIVSSLRGIDALLNDNPVYTLGARTTSYLLMEPELEDAIELVPSVEEVFGSVEYLYLFMNYDSLDMRALNQLEYFIYDPLQEAEFRYEPEQLEWYKESRLTSRDYIAQTALSCPLVRVIALSDNYLEKTVKDNSDLAWFDWEAFERGELCILIRPEHVSEELSPKQGEVLTLTNYLINDEDGADPGEKSTYIPNREETIKVGYVSAELNGAVFSTSTFIVYCSYGFAEKLFTPLSDQPGFLNSLSGLYAEQFGLDMLNIYADTQACYELTDKTISQLSVDMGGQIVMNNRLYLVESAQELENAMLTTILITAVVVTALIVLQVSLRLADLNQQRREFGLRFALGDPQGRQIWKAGIKGVLLSVGAIGFGILFSITYNSLQRIMVFYERYQMIVEVKESFALVIEGIPYLLSYWAFWLAFGIVLVVNLLIQLLPMRTIFHSSPAELFRDE